MTWQFDDLINLRTLSGVSTYAGLIDFVFGGLAGPMGRPLSLVTFVANYDDWTGNPWGVARLNVVLHCINAALIMLISSRLLVQLVRATQGAWLNERSVRWAAIAVAVVWLAMPIHASSILMPVQRMTLLSGFFTLATIFAYLVVRARYAGAPGAMGMVTLSAVVAAGTLLSVLAKENGATTIAMVALIEVFFFSRSPATASVRRCWSLWLTLAFLAVPLALTHHLITQWDGIQGRFIFYRGYSMADHMATQAVISWEYLRQIVLPRAALLGPYHDGHAVYTWRMWQPYASLTLWVALGALGVSLRRRINGQAATIGRLTLFAIAWFAISHQIESTVIPLELYFEHRNYLAAWGIAFAVVGAGFFLVGNKGHGTLVRLGLCAWALVLFVGLQQITSLWGQPMLANEMWRMYHPASARATQALAGDYLRIGFQDAALRIADEFAVKNDAIDVAIQFFPKYCEISSDAELRSRFSQLEQMVERTKRPGGIPTGLAGMGNAIRAGKCEGVGVGDYAALLSQLLANRAVQWNPAVRHHLYYESALTALAMDDLPAYAGFAERAFLAFPSISIAQSVLLTLFSYGELDMAISWAERALSSAPSGILRRAWAQELNGIQQALLSVREQINNSNGQIAPGTRE